MVVIKLSLPLDQISPSPFHHCLLISYTFSLHSADAERTQEIEGDTSQQEGFETSNVEDSFDVLHDESDEEEKDGSGRDRFKSERSQATSTNTNTIPDSLGESLELDYGFSVARCKYSCYCAIQ